MKKFLAWMIILTLALVGSASAMEIGNLLGGLTSMFSPGVDESFGPGEVAELENINIELTNVLESESNDFYTAEKGYEFIIIEFSIENKADEDLTLSSMLNFSTWCDKKMYSISLEALGTALLAGKVQLDCVVESGKTVTGVIGYEVPVDWAEIVIEYKSDVIGGEKANFVVTR